ncbi:MAG: aspartate aminotransferase family protein [Dehalococcoidia bacterium]
MATILETYERNHEGSAALFAEASAVFPGGVTHDTRHVTPFPLYVEHATGSRKWDVDGNEIIDYVMGHGALLLGHSRPEVVEAVRAQVGRGTHLGASHRLEIDWGRIVQQLIPSAERVRFTSSGTEATQMAVRLARAFTGKDKLLKFESHFHGWSDTVTGNIVPGAEYPRASGVPQQSLSQQVILPPNDRIAVERTLEENADIAAVILEPTGAHMGATPIEPQFLRDLRELCTKAGVILIFDEVVTGFRASPGGVQALYNVIPDMTTLAKILAGGLPGGAVVGRAEIVNRIAFGDDAEWNRSERVAHPGTFNANPLSSVAGRAALEIVAIGAANAHADAMALLLAQGMNEVIQQRGAKGCVYGLASMLHIILGQECLPPKDGIAWRWQDSQHRWVPGMGPGPATALKRGLINEGVDLMSGGIMLVSAAHTENDVGQTVAAFDRTVGQMLGEGLI